MKCTKKIKLGLCEFVKEHIAENKDGRGRVAIYGGTVVGR